MVLEKTLESPLDCKEVQPGQARGEGEEAKSHAACSSSGRRRIGSVEELEREPSPPTLGRAIPPLEAPRRPRPTVTTSNDPRVRESSLLASDGTHFCSASISVARTSQRSHRMTSVPWPPNRNCMRDLKRELPSGRFLSRRADRPSPRVPPWALLTRCEQRLPSRDNSKRHPTLPWEKPSRAG